MWDRKKEKRVVVNVKLLVSLATTKCLVCAALLLVSCCWAKAGERLLDLLPNATGIWLEFSSAPLVEKDRSARRSEPTQTKHGTPCSVVAVPKNPSMPRLAGLKVLIRRRPPAVHHFILILIGYVV
jgi:hypothetical protein